MEQMTLVGTQATSYVSDEEILVFSYGIQDFIGARMESLIKQKCSFLICLNLLVAGLRVVRVCITKTCL